MAKLSLYIMIGLLNAFSLSQSWAAGEDDSWDGGIGNHEDYAVAQQALKSSDYPKAIALLKKVNQEFPQKADVLNLLGYSYRKMENYPVSLEYYQQALKIDPTHRGANEYLGELYLQTGHLAKAEERLEVLDKACLFGCEEYDELKEAIEAYKKKHNL